jgi:serine/threonine-protein kinase RsbW
MARPDDDLTEDEAGHLYAAARALLAARTAADVAQAVFDHALRDLGANTAGFWLLTDSVVHFAGGAGYTNDAPQRVGTIPIDSDLPAAECIRTGAVVSYGSVGERDARWPSLAGMDTPSEAVVVLPLVARDSSLGCLHIGFGDAGPIADKHLPFLRRLAELGASALDRAQLYDTERGYREQLEFFAEATSVLIRSLEPGVVMQALVDIAVPRLADWCLVLTPDGDVLRAVALRLASDPDVAARDMPDVFPISSDAPAARAFRTGQSQTIGQIPESRITTLDPRSEAVVRRAGIASALVQPILWAGQPIGVLVLAFIDPVRPLDPLLKTTAEGLALRAGVALHNASMYERERRMARTLAEALLPQTTPPIPGYECAVRYLPAAGDVAGDWYDVLELGTRFFVGVGDAAGHGIPAASLMAQLRNAARGLAAAGQTPDELLSTLSTLADTAGGDLFATALYGILDPETHELEWATAGHPPPALLRGTTVEFVNGGPGDAPIASGVGGPRSTRRLSLRPGDALVLYTDGVIERRREHLDVGLEQLVSLLEASAGESADSIADRIVNVLCGDATDDCSVLVLRRVH